MTAAPSLADGAPASFETSFDCRKAPAWTEQQICVTQSLADADRQLAALYASALGRATGADRIALRESQRSWIRDRNGCGDVACIEQAYAARTEYLQNWGLPPTPSSDSSQGSDQTLTQGRGLQGVRAVEQDPSGSGSCPEYWNDAVGAVIDGTLARTFCNDAEIAKLNKRDLSLQVAIYNSRGSSHDTRGLLLGSLEVCLAYDKPRECMIARLNDDIELLSGRLKAPDGE